MPFSLEAQLAYRYLRSRKKEGFISVIAGFSLVGIALGVATLIVVMAVMNGFREELFSKILSMDGHVNVVNMQQGIPDDGDYAKRLGALPGVVSARQLIEGQAIVMREDMTVGVGVRGMSQADIEAKGLGGDSLREGTIEGFDAGEGVLIGYRMAENLAIGLGDSVTLLSPRMHTTAIGTVPRMKQVPVVGIFDAGMYEYDSSVVLMPMGLAQRFYQLTGRVNVVELRIEEPMDAAGFSLFVRDQARPEDMVYNWQRSHANFVNALGVERNVMFLILTLIILVAAFNIITGLIMLVKDKEAEIAILRTIGATRGAVMRLFFMCGASLGVFGTLSGLGLGLAFAMNIESIRQVLEGMTGRELFSAEIYFLSTLPAKVVWGDVWQVGIMALCLTFVATIYPAWRAARTEPAEALRYGG